MYRAERLDGNGMVEGYYHEATLNYQGELRMFVVFDGVKEYNQVKPETLEIYLFGSWHKVSELETKYKLVEV